MSDKDSFYVGYLPLPKPIKQFILPWLVGNLVLAVGIAALVASQDREPGDGVWETSQAVTIEGLLTTAPYPLLRAADKTYILVEQGKIGVQERIAREQIEEGKVRAIGFLIERDGRTILELDATQSDPIESILPKTSVLVDRDKLREITAHFELHRFDGDYGTHTLNGEIVDPKCYLGVMQPGDGKTHKVCATLCIKGGIPPMFLVRDKKGNTAAYLLTDAEGNAFPESHYAYIADPIELTGEVHRDGDLLTLRADLDSIRRFD